MNAPCNRSDECHVDCRQGRPLEIWRKRTRGPLAGWYASIALHKRAFVTYSETEARICASQQRRVTAPIPPGATIQSVQAVPHGDNEPFDYEHETVPHDGGHAIRLWVPDSGGEIMYISVKYGLDRPGRSRG